MTSLQIIILVAALAQFVFELFLKLKNERHMASMRSVIPSGVEAVMDEDTWKKATDYSIEKSKSSRLEELIGILLFPFFLLFLFPWTFGKWSTSLNDSIWQCASVTICFLTVIQLPNLIFDWKRQFVLEEKYGFNKSTKKLWLTDKIKETILSLVIGLCLLSFLIWLYRSLSTLMPDFWWILAFGSFFAIQLLLMILWPKVILPLFNKLSPLEEGELKDRLMGLSEKTGFKAKTIEVIDGSKRSGHSNAYFTGFGRFRRIVLYDTLIKQMEIEEIEAVLAHEVGHYKLGHIPKRMALSFVLGLLSFAVMALLLKSPWFYAGLGMPANLMGSFSSLVVGLGLSVGFFTYWITPLNNHLSRRHEYEADQFAKDSVNGPEPLVRALRKLYVENLNHPIPHRVMASFHYSHPTLPEREKALLAG